MIRTVRAAGFAVAAFAFAAMLWSGPLQADQGGAGLSATSWLDHAAAAGEVSDIGLNDAAEAGEGAGEAVRTAGAIAEHMVALADAALPRPRTLPELVRA